MRFYLLWFQSFFTIVYPINDFETFWISYLFQRLTILFLFIVNNCGRLCSEYTIKIEDSFLLLFHLFIFFFIFIKDCGWNFGSGANNKSRYLIFKLCDFIRHVKILCTKFCMCIEIADFLLKKDAILLREKITFFFFWWKCNFGWNVVC